MSCKNVLFFLLLFAWGETAVASPFQYSTAFTAFGYMDAADEVTDFFRYREARAWELIRTSKPTRVSWNLGYGLSIVSGGVSSPIEQNMAFGVGYTPLERLMFDFNVLPNWMIQDESTRATIEIRIGYLFELDPRPPRYQIVRNVYGKEKKYFIEDDEEEVYEGRTLLTRFVFSGTKFLKTVTETLRYEFVQQGTGLELVYAPDVEWNYKFSAVAYWYNVDLDLELLQSTGYYRDSAVLTPSRRLSADFTRYFFGKWQYSVGPDLTFYKPSSTSFGVGVHGAASHVLGRKWQVGLSATAGYVNGGVGTSFGLNGARSF